jgi:hypothetical protein
MSRLLSLLLVLLLTASAFAQEAVLSKDDSPPISITSPDTGSTYVYGSLKGRQLYWNKFNKILIARVTFTNADLLDDSTPQDDTMEFRLPGVAFDEARGVFSATSAKGEVIPVAHIKKTLFIKTVEILPNARVRIIRQRGTVNVILEAISPNDPAMHPAPTQPGGERQVDIRQIFN